MNKIVGVLSFVLLLGLLFGCGNELESYDISKYTRIIEEYPSAYSVEPIENARDAKRKAHEIWIEVYGRSRIAFEKPYTAFYDPLSETWFVTGTVPFWFNRGGAACIIFHEEGRVLAVWHEK